MYRDVYLDRFHCSRHEAKIKTSLYASINNFGLILSSESRKNTLKYV